MVEHVGWESVFFLNVPIGIVAFALATRTVRESRSEVERQLDPVGLSLGSLGLFSLTYGLIEANQEGWTDPVILTALGAAALLIGAFLIWESRAPHAMMPLSYFKIPAFSAGNTVAFSVSLGMFSIFLFMSLYMQQVRGYTAFGAGLRFLPMTLAIIVTAPLAGKYAQRHGSRSPMTYGLILVASGLLALTQVGVETPYWLIGVLFLMMGHGMGATMAPMTAAVMGAVGPQRAGMGSAMTNTSREVGGVLGIALLGTVLFGELKATIAPLLAGVGLAPAQQTAIVGAASHGAVTPGLLTALGLTPEQQDVVSGALREAYMAGFHRALFIAAAIMFAAAIVANRFIPGRRAAPNVDPVAESVPANA